MLGIMRCAAYTSTVNCPLYVPVPEGETRAVRDSAIEHFYDKLLKIKDRFKTEMGRKQGQKRHDLVSSADPDQILAKADLIVS